MLCNLTEGGQVREFIQLLPPTTVLPATHYIPHPTQPIQRQMTLCFLLHTLTTPPYSLSGLYDFFLVSPNSITNTPPPPPPPPTHTHLTHDYAGVLLPLLAHIRGHNCTVWQTASHSKVREGRWGFYYQEI